MTHHIPVVIENSIPTAQIIEWAFKALITGIVGLGVRYVSGLKESIDRLNVNIAVIVERVQSHEKRISLLERRRKQ